MYPSSMGQHIKFFSLGLLLAFLFVTSNLFPQSMTTARNLAPVQSHEIQSGNTLRVMSWNAYFLNKEVDAFLATVAAIQPDVIALQEVSELMADAIAMHLHDQYPYMTLYPSSIPAGSAVLSRYPFHRTTPPDYSEQSGCNCEIVEIELDEQRITLINAHPWPPTVAPFSTSWSNLFALDTATQDPIFDQLLIRIEATTTPLLVVGDMNTMPFQPNLQRLTARLTDAFAAAGVGPGYTFPAQSTDHDLPPFPFIRIDYILHDDTWHTEQIWNGAIAGSDHLFVVADLSYD